MNSTRTTTGNANAESKKAAGPAAFAAKAPLIDKPGPDDIQRALHNEYDMGCAQPARLPSQRGFMELSDQNYDHHLF